MNVILEKIKEHAIPALTWLALALLTFYLGLLIFGRWSDNREMAKAWLGIDPSCNVAVIPVTGPISILPFFDPAAASDTASQPQYASADDVLMQIRNAVKDPYTDGMLVRIDSPGGTAGASVAIMNELKRAQKPTVALIREIGTSGGYMVALGADRIIASPFADVGSIGVTSSFLNYAAKNQRDGIQYVQLSSGPFKDIYSPDKPVTAADRALIERDLKIYADQFIDMVAERRNLPRAAVEKLADGSSMPGGLALQNGLVDELGDQETSRVWLSQQLGRDIVFCE